MTYQTEIPNTAATFGANMTYSKVSPIRTSKENTKADIHRPRILIGEYYSPIKARRKSASVSQ